MRVFNRGRWLGVAILGWTLLAWGGRIGLLDRSDGWADWARIYGSIIVGVVVAVVLWLRPPSRIQLGGLYLFAAWTAVIWVRSMVVNWTGGGTFAFKLVHTALAVGFALLTWLAISFARRDLVSRPDQGGGK